MLGDWRIFVALPEKIPSARSKSTTHTHFLMSFNFVHAEGIFSRGQSLLQSRFLSDPQTADVKSDCSVIDSYSIEL